MSLSTEHGRRTVVACDQALTEASELSADVLELRPDLLELTISRGEPFDGNVVRLADGPQLDL